MLQQSRAIDSTARCVGLSHRTAETPPVSIRTIPTSVGVSFDEIVKPNFIMPCLCNSPLELYASNRR